MTTYMRTSVNYLLVLASALLLLTACDSTEPEENGAGEEEVITTVTLLLQGSAGSVTATWADPDGDGGNDPTIDPLVLSSGATYSGRIQLSDASDPGDVEDITAEIEEEADEHQFFYIPEGDLAGNLTVTITDMDGNGLPVGLEFDVTTTAAASDTLRVILSHYDDAPKNGTDRSDETDVEIEWPVTIN